MSATQTQIQWFKWSRTFFIIELMVWLHSNENWQPNNGENRKFMNQMDSAIHFYNVPFVVHCTAVPCFPSISPLLHIVMFKNGVFSKNVPTKLVHLNNFKERFTTSWHDLQIWVDFDLSTLTLHSYDFLYSIFNSFQELFSINWIKNLNFNCSCAHY